MSPRTKKQFEEMRTERKDEILASALKLFSHKGYHATSIREIAEEVGMSKGLLYNYFTSKDELLAALFNQYIQIMHGLINPDNDAEISTQEMKGFFVGMIASFQENNDYWRLYLQLSMQPEVISFLLTEIHAGEEYIHMQKLMYSYFEKRFENPYEEFMLCNSMLKGFAIMLVLTPEMFTQEQVKGIEKRFVDMFVRDKIPEQKSKSSNLKMPDVASGSYPLDIL